MESYRYSRAVPVWPDFDVVVAGAGPAGLCAAAAAARQGARVALLERFGAVGGCLTLGHVTTCMGAVPPGTMKDEIGALLGTGGACVPHSVENAKYTLSRWLAEAGVTLFLQTQAVDVRKEGDRVCGVVVSTPEGLGLLPGRTVVDATGDGALCALAGVRCTVGRDVDGLTQPASILFTIGGVDSDLTCTHESDDTVINGESYLALCEEASRTGELPADVTIVRLYGGGKAGERLVNATQLCRVNGVRTSDVAAADLTLRGQMRQVLSFLRRRIPGFENAFLLDSADTPGFRETRRIEGDYCLTAADISAGRTFPDVMVHRANFCFDTHNPAGGGQAEALEEARNTRPYDIPYRCFLPRGVEGLLAAGRCISGTHKAHSSYRVMNICMAMGEAAGIAAALSAAGGVPPRGLDVGQVQQVLLDKGVPLFD